ncbi:MAG: hypothetical protein H6730_31360 [Deltaproteobacteria bacterium]|nr:hypothetical protein [Deltaproteobacteria bacterium]
MRLFLGLVFALIPLAAACSGGGDDPDGGLSASSCGVAAEAAAAECAGLDQCGAGAQNYAVDPTCEHCPGRADSQLCEAGACRDVSGLELVLVQLAVTDKAVGAPSFTIATLNPISADGTRVTCEKLLSSACTVVGNSGLNFTNSTHKQFGGGGAATGMVYQTGISGEPGTDRIVLVQATSALGGDGDVVARACVEGVTIPLPAEQPRLGITLE